MILRAIRRRGCYDCVWRPKNVHPRTEVDMIELMVDEQIRAKLHNLEEAPELRDNNGRILGHFISSPTHHPRVAETWQYEGVDSPTSYQELLRRAQEGGGRTWPEIRADLERSA